MELCTEQNRGAGRKCEGHGECEFRCMREQGEQGISTKFIHCAPSVLCFCSFCGYGNRSSQELSSGQCSSNSTTNRVSITGGIHTHTSASLHSGQCRRCCSVGAGRSAAVPLVFALHPLRAHVCPSPPCNSTASALLLLAAALSL